MHDEILRRVQKPSYYTGGEYGSVTKERRPGLLRYAFCFPDTYDIGMSYLGGKILYGLLNSIEDVWCERVFAPAEDMEAEMRAANLPLFALESQDAVKDFDLVGFTLQTELNFSNILNMLDLAGIPLLSKERTSPFPLIHAGGPCAYNPEPMADFMDFFVVGEGEEVNPEIVDAVRLFKAEGGTDKTELLRRLAKIEGVYVPSFYDVTYHEDGTIASFVPNDPTAPPKVTKRLIKDLDSVYYPESVVIPFADVVHDRVMLEVFRGCIRGCRFCQAGTIYRPVREKSPEVLDRCAAAQIAATGYDEISPTSLSTSDYTELMSLTDKMMTWCDPAMVSLSLPSLRVDNFSMELMEKVQRVRKGGLTFAAEAGTQRMRDVINKQVTEEELHRTCAIAFAGGWTGIKLYFMIGLPYEEDADVEGIADLAQMVVDTYYNCPEHPKGKAVRVTISVATFIPKPFTPFQWAPQDDGVRVNEKVALIRKSIRTGKIVFHYHDPKTSHFEAVLARGDRRLCPAILEAWRMGAKFDGWDRYFKYDLWISAFKKCGIDPDWYALRARPYDEILPWDFIDCGVSKEHLIRESEKAKEAAKTPNCREGCAGCGADRLTGGIAMQGVRLYFAKQGRGVYISHLDMVRAMARGLSRAGIRVKYTEGFNPIPYLVFGQPLSLGYAGLREVCDFSILSNDMPVEAVAPAVAAVMPEVILPIASAPPVNKLGAITMADYTVRLKSEKPITKDQVEEVLTRPEIVVLKKTKRGEAMTDIAPLIYSLEVEGDLTIRCRLACSSGLSLNPSYLIKVLNDAYPDTGIGWLSVERTRFLLPGGVDFS